MSVLDVVAGRLGYQRKATVGRTVTGPYSWPVWRQGEPDWTPTTLLGFALAAYGDNPIAFRCIAVKASAPTAAPLVAYTGERAAPERLPDADPLAQLLLRPNPHQSWTQLEELARVYLELDGNVFMYLAGRAPRLGQLSMVTPAGVFLLRSDRVRVVPGRSRTEPILGYVYDPDDSGMFNREPFLPDEIVHIKYPNPTDLFEGLGRGLSPLCAAAKSVDVDNAATSFLKSFFEMGVVPVGLLKSKQHMVDAEVARVKARFREQYGGYDKWSEVMVLDADADYQRMGLSMQEMTFDKLDMRNESRICMALGVPPIIVGAQAGLQRSTFANYAEAREAFWEDVLIPQNGRFEDGYNLKLAADGRWLAYDYDNVPALAAGRARKWATAAQAYTSGIAKRNEARAIVKLPPVDEDEDGFKPGTGGNDPLPLGAVGAPDGAAAAGGLRAQSRGEDEPRDPDDDEGLDEGAAEKRRPFRGPTRGLITRDAKAVDLGFDPGAPGGDRRAELARLNREMEERLSRALQEDLERQLAEVVRWGRRVRPGAVGEEAMEPPAPRTLAKVVIPVLRDAATVGAAEAAVEVAQLGIGLDWSLVATEAVQWAQGYSYELVRGIDETSRRLLQREIRAWLEAGTPLAELQGALGAIFGRHRGELIAITEATRAFAEGKMRTWETINREAGQKLIVGRRWLTANDELVCPVCSALGGVLWDESGAVPTSRDAQRENALVAPLGERFVHPGGNGAQGQFAGRTYPNPPAHPRCRCKVVAVVLWQGTYKALVGGHWVTLPGAELLKWNWS